MNLKIIDLKGNINILTIINVNQVAKLDHNLLSIIFLAKKNVNVFLKKTCQLLKIVINKKVFSLDNIIRN